MRKLGRYYLEELVGVGGFAKVYKAVDPRLDSTVAIKVLAEQWTANPEIRERFTQEAVLLRKIQSTDNVKGLTDVYDIDESTSGEPFFVMTYADQGNLSDRIKTLESQQDIELQAGLDALGQLIGFLAETLGAMHGLNIIHRDVKPSNILIRSKSSQAKEAYTKGIISPNETYLIGDLGLAKSLDEENSSLSLAIGTQKYAAPEIFGTSELDHRADIYSASVLIKDLASRITGLSPQLSKALEKGLSHDPNHRYASTVDWRDALTEAMQQHKTEPSKLPPPANTSYEVVEKVAIDAEPLRSKQMHPQESGSIEEMSKKIFSTKRFAIVMLPLVVSLAVFITYISYKQSNEITSDTILFEGPATVKVGETAIYSANAKKEDVVIWSDWNGNLHYEQYLRVTPTQPGTLDFDLQVGAQKTAIEIKVIE